jgi:hypothetical protein
MDATSIKYVSQVPNGWDWTSADKELWHKKAQAYLRMIAKLMGLKPGEYKVSSNKGGCAVLGDVMLHTEHVYLSLGGFDSFFYRGCTKGGFRNRDYGTGFGPFERNINAAYENLNDPAFIANCLNTLTAGVRQHLAA